MFWVFLIKVAAGMEVMRSKTLAEGGKVLLGRRMTLPQNLNPDWEE
jgi:hypothetical protein